MVNTPSEHRPRPQFGQETNRDRTGNLVENLQLFGGLVTIKGSGQPDQPVRFSKAVSEGGFDLLHFKLPNSDQTVAIIDVADIESGKVSLSY